MNVLAIVPDLQSASCRFRVRQYREPLSRDGIDLRVAALGSGGRERRRRFDRAGDFDAVLVHRCLLNPFDFRRLRRAARRLVFDFDDALMYRDSNSPRRLSWQRRAGFRRMISEADLVIAGNEYLAGLASRGSGAVRVLPTPVDLAPFPDRPQKGRGMVVGWMGTKSNFIYLGLVEEPLRNLSRARPGFVFQVISDGLPALSDVPLVPQRWSLQSEVRDLLGFDVGIMPLLDDEWTRGKCALKILQYFAAFLPVICSPVGTNCEVVKDGVSGIFARSPREWEEGIAGLLDSPERRETMGLSGRRLVEEKYSLAVVAPRFAALLRENKQ